ncbi:MAG: peptidase [Acidobacteria bacterium]|nr:MAG: peptidase [Acidobacteriota bacterium]REK01516.1 MAG: peptidase [Acidobacteriota bacterium]REK14472.1 MAG: peptidase [Acidobacteriota bacterium]REK45187.1 MAG: peptidase [Acidobacteriota bacterium]
MNSVILFFVDGLGIGKREDHNPLSKCEAGPLAHFQEEEHPVELGGHLARTDATLGVEGRPQSASGQTTILTGVNAPKKLGRHKQGFPNEELREIIRTGSIFKKLKQAGIGPNVFANTYTPQFFEGTPRWKSATTVAVESAGMDFCRIPDMLGGRSVFHDFTNRSLRERGFDVPEYSPEKAAEILARLSEDHRFVLYEHFITDKIGHAMDSSHALVHLPELAEFLRLTVKFTDPERTTVILTSDHGNIENLSVRNHTLNKVPTVVWGRDAETKAKGIRDLTDIAPTVHGLLTE